MTDQMCLILAGGDAALPVDPIPHPAFVIAADGGLVMAGRLGLEVDLVVGDLDSVDATAFDVARRNGALVEAHPREKDATDLELALDAAAARGFTRVMIVGGTAIDRIDHLLANAGLVAAPRYAALHLEWRTGPSRVVPLHDSTTVEGEPGDLVSIIPVGGSATVSSRGLQWELGDEPLDTDSSRSVSNRLTRPTAEISISDGRALVIHTRGTSR